MTPSFLEAILAVKKTEIEGLYKASGASFRRPGKWAKVSFCQALLGPQIRLIGELKKASPSKGIIRSDFDPIQLAIGFEKQGAAALSVLTETQYFLGDLAYLGALKDAGIQLPLLRKDFIIDPTQVMASWAAGADAILLICKILSPETLRTLHALARSIGLDVLVEVHNQDELALAQSLDGIQLIGINNRNLATFEVDPTLASRLIRTLPSVRTFGCVAESGYQTIDELNALQTDGFNAVLIGEGLAKNPDLLSFFGAKNQ